MYQAYTNDRDADNDHTVGAGAADPGKAMNSIRDYHARFVCAATADYTIVGPDAEVVAHVTMPDPTAGHAFGNAVGR